MEQGIQRHIPDCQLAERARRQQTADGGFIVAGYESTGAYTARFWVLKLDREGNIQWQRVYGDQADSAYAYAVQQTQDGGYIVAGKRGSAIPGGVWVLKLDASGAVQWQKAYGYMNAFDIRPTSDGGYAVVGSSSESASTGDATIIKLDAGGNVQWAKSYGGPKNDVFYQILQVPGGGYVVAGVTLDSAEHGSAVAMETDASGNVRWQRSYGGGGANGILARAGGYVLFGGMCWRCLIRTAA